MTTATASAPTNAHEIRFSRVYDAPVGLVWDAWTDPAQVAKWWGPRGFSITTHSKDLRAGGTWVYTMHGPDGTDYPNYTRYHEVVPNKRLVYDHGATSADTKSMFRVTVDFREKDGRTMLDMRMTMQSAEELEKARAIIKSASGYSTWDRLAEQLEKDATEKEIFVINRSFDAPIDTMWEMWTDPAHFAQWLPPTGFTMEFRRVDIRTGGHGFYAMTNGQWTMYGRVDYLEVRRPDRLVYTQHFADEQENMSRHPAMPTWPAKMLTTVALTSEGESQTRVSIRWEVVGDATAEEMATFVGGRAGMTGGWTGSFDKLEALLASSFLRERVERSIEAANDDQSVGGRG